MWFVCKLGISNREQSVLFNVFRKKLNKIISIISVGKSKTLNLDILYPCSNLSISQILP